MRDSYLSKTLHCCVSLFIGFSFCCPPTSLAQTQLIEILGSAAGDQFGNGAACYGPAVVVGAPGKTVTSVSNVGGASLYLPASSITPRSFPIPFDTNLGNEMFGYSVAIIDDVTGDGLRDYVIGALGDSFFNSQFGSFAFLYADPGSGAIGAPVRGLTGPSGSAGSQFGATIVQLGDITSDGKPEVVIGAPNGASGNGTATVIDPTIDQIILQANGSASEKFGFSIAAFGPSPGDSDNLPDFVVGGPDFGSSTSVGRVSFIGSGTEGAFAVITGVDASLAFGYSVANVGDVTGDSVDDLLVGAPVRSGVTANIGGHAYLFSGASLITSVLTTADAICDISSTNRSFGVAVRGLGNVANDGIKRFGISQPSAGGGSQGQILLYQFAGGACSLTSTLTGTTANDRLGISIFGSLQAPANNGCDLNADGVSDFGASTDSRALGASTGSVVLFAGPAPTPTPTPTPTATPTPIGPSSTTLRSSVSPGGDFSALVRYDRSLVGQGCKVKLLGRLELNGSLSGVMQLSSTTVDKTGVQFLANNLPDVEIRECVRPILHLITSTQCSTVVTRSNVSSSFLNCSNSSRIPSTRWLELLASRISNTAAAALAKSHKPATKRFARLKFSKTRKGPNYIKEPCKVR